MPKDNGGDGVNGVNTEQRRNGVILVKGQGNKKISLRTLRYLPTARRFAKFDGRPALRMRRCAAATG
jgi:hypothetical protein